jgi:hypothetical protein
VEIEKGEASETNAATLRARAGNLGLQAVIGRMAEAHEQEADRVSGAVMRSPTTVQIVERLCVDCNSDLNHLQRQPDPDAPDPTTAAALASTTSDPVDALIDAIAVAIADPLATITAEPAKDPKRALTPQLVLKQQWPPIRRWIIDLGTRKATRVPAAFAALDTPEITEAILALPKTDRVRVADGVLDRLIPSVGSEAPETYREEFKRLDKNARSALEPSADPIVGYVAMRDGLKATFGSIAAMNAYFGTLVPADFPSGATQKVFGRDSLVHPDLKAALQKATDYLKSNKVPPGTFDRMVAGLADVTTLAGKVNHRGSWAISIRENRNNPSEIGNHSFGFAIDIDANANPNLPKFRWDIVKGLTGFDVYGPDIAGAKAGQPYATALQSAQHFRAASDTFRAKFDSQPHFEATLAAEAAKHQVPIAPAELFKAVAAAAQHGEPGADGLASLKRLLLDALNQEEARTAVPESSGGDWRVGAQEDPLVLYTLASALRPKIRSRADLIRLMPFITAQVTNPLDTPSFPKTAELAILFDRKVIAELKRVPEHVRRYELPNNLRLRLLPPAKDAEVATLAASLVELHGIFVGTRDKQGQPIGQGTSLSAVAVHGFMNLQPELVAALTSSEGGNLVWLGATLGTKDWMHFQLKSPPKITPQGTWP